MNYNNILVNIIISSVSSHRSIPGCNNDPDSAYVLGIYHHFDSESMAHLVATFYHDDFFADFVAENVVNYSFGIVMGELDWESFESVALWDVVLDACLEFVIGESLTADSFEFIVAQGCLKKVG